MPYLHLPVQSGSDKILKAMNRKHTIQSYLDVLAKFKKAQPDIALSSDFIVGFPGETDEDFEQTMELVREVGFASAYSFKYSARPGTPAANMQNLVREDVKDERLQRLQSVLFEQGLAFNQSFVGKTVEVLFDGRQSKPGQLHGRTRYNTAVHAVANDRLFGQLAEVVIDSAGQMALHGKVKTIGD
jgi:tRNA-2-methylthio-N6-dimethylallyladenosine synthase